MKYLKRYENPNQIQYKDKYIDWAFAETYVFSYYGSDELYIKKGMFTHTDLLWDLLTDKEISKETYDKYEGDFNEYYSRGECAGRLFVSDHGKPINVISFWKFPKDNDEMKKLAKDIKKKTGINIWNKKWKVEVILDKNIENSTERVPAWTTRNVDFIPVKDYRKSEEREEEEMKIPHLMNWKEKEELKKRGWGHGFGSDLTAWGGKNPLQWRQAKYQESMNNKLNEDPDYLEYYKEGELIGLSYHDVDAIPFSYKEEKEDVVIGEYGTTHSHNQITEVDGYIYPGRLWIRHKIISFWVYPEKLIFINIINSLENKLRRKLWNQDWKVEVLKKYEEDKPFIGDYYEEQGNLNPFFIPIEEYVGSENVPEEKKDIHLMSWEEKQALKKKGWGRGWGSDLTAWGGKNPLQWRQAKYQESYKMRHLKRFEAKLDDIFDDLPYFKLDLRLMFIKEDKRWELIGICVASAINDPNYILYFHPHGLDPDVYSPTAREPISSDNLDDTDELVRYLRTHFDDCYPIIEYILDNHGQHVAQCEKNNAIEFRDIEQVQKIIDVVYNAIVKDRKLMGEVRIKRESDKFNI